MNTRLGRMLPCAFFPLLRDAVRPEPLGDKRDGDGRHARPSPSFLRVFNNLADNERGKNARGLEPMARRSQRGTRVVKGLARGGGSNAVKGRCLCRAPVHSR
jgi:hypothetical protein